MKTRLKFLLSILLLSTALISAQDELIIQEDTIGVCTMDGIIDSSSSGLGFTGIGYANIDNGVGIGMSWSFEVIATGEYQVTWRYALGGADETSRNAKLLVNNVFTSDTVKFPFTGLWSNWEMTDTITVNLEAGLNNIRLVSITSKGLPNLDYFKILGSDITPSECLPSFTFSIDKNDPDGGSVSYSPVQEFYDLGTEITVNATVNSGYFFHSWSGEASSIETLFTFQINENIYLTALFYPEGTTMDTNIIGYASVQHDNGTPYLLTGGSMGTEVEVSTLEDLKTYLEDENNPYIVTLTTHLQTDNKDEIKIASNKTFLGTENAHLENIEISINGVRNVIIRNLTFSKVLRADEMEINGGSKNIWIDHCEFFTDRDHDYDEDYYDGLLDIKNESSFITVSWCNFHDHNKGILICSGDDSFQDSVQRITFHHNYFHNINSRLPSIRFGKSHIFNNYYKDCETAVNTRMNACVQVEKNYFQDVGNGVGMLYSPIPGGVELIDNIFENTSYSEEPACDLDVPYSYSSFLNNTEDLPTLIPANVRYTVENTGISSKSQQFEYKFKCYPNPANGNTTITFNLPKNDFIAISLFDILGYQIKIFDKKEFNKGLNKIEFNTSNFKAGVYFLQLKSDNIILENKLIIQ